MTNQKPTVSEQRRFLEQDIQKLERSLHHVWVFVTGECFLLKPSIATCWNAIVKREPDIPDSVYLALVEALKTRQVAYDNRLTREQLNAGIEAVDQVRVFFFERFASREGW